MSSWLECLLQRASFQGLSQETLSMCVQSLTKASDTITKTKVSWWSTKLSLVSLVVHWNFSCRLSIDLWIVYSLIYWLISLSSSCWFVGDVLVVGHLTRSKTTGSANHPPLLWLGLHTPTSPAGQPPPWGLTTGRWLILGGILIDWIYDLLMNWLVDL